MCYLDWAKTTSYTACSSWDSLSWCTSQVRLGRDTWNIQHFTSARIKSECVDVWTNAQLSCSLQRIGSAGLSKLPTSYDDQTLRHHLKTNSKSSALNVMFPWGQKSNVYVRPYQWFSCGVQLVFASSEQKTPRQDVESLSASLRAVVHLSFPESVLIKRRTTQKPEERINRVQPSETICTSLDYNESAVLLTDPKTTITFGALSGEKHSFTHQCFFVSTQHSLKAVHSAGTWVN